MFKNLPFYSKQTFEFTKSKLLPIPYCYGPEFFKYRKLLEKSQWLSLKKIHQYQLNELKKLVWHAYKNVPYYKKKWQRHGFHPKQLKTLKDLELIPFTTKAEVKKNMDKMLARNFKKYQLQYVTTGGTTGTPLGFYLERKTNYRRIAFEWRNWNWGGYNFNDKCISIRGNVINKYINGKRYWKAYNYVNNSLMLSSYHLTRNNLPKYIQTIEEYKPKTILGYPSTLLIIANYILEKKLHINKKKYLKAIFTSSETLFDWQRKKIEKAFDCQMFNKYGNCEQVTIIGQCEQDNLYHEAMEYGITELVKDDKVIDQTNVEGEIVGTAFTNYAVPFIRYKTGDYAVKSAKKCPCGRELQTYTKIIGRVQEMVKTSKGNLISMTAINMHSNVFDNIERFQFFQDKPGIVTMKIIKKPSYNRNDSQYIKEELNKKFGPHIKLYLKFVKEIPLTRRGKHQFLEQKLKIDDY